MRGPSLTGPALTGPSRVTVHISAIGSLGARERSARTFAAGAWAGKAAAGPAPTAISRAMSANALQDMVVWARRTPYNSVFNAGSQTTGLPPVKHQTIVVLDFGSQFTQLIAR